MLTVGWFCWMALLDGLVRMAFLSIGANTLQPENQMTSPNDQSANRLVWTALIDYK